MGEGPAGQEDISPEVLEAAVAGEPWAFEAIVARYENAAFAVAYRMCHDRHLAADVTQDIFLQLYQQLHRYDRSRPFAPWFFKLATNRTINSLKQRRNRRRRVLSELGDEDGRDPAERAESREPAAPVVASRGEEAARLRELIAGLPEKYAAIVALRYLREMSVDDIAATLEMPSGTVKVRLYRARDLLRRRLEEGGWAPSEEGR